MVAPRLVLLLVAAVASLACLGLAPVAAAEESYVLIKGGTVVNHDASERADVLIAGGKIARVGPPGTVDFPLDAAADEPATEKKKKKRRKTIDATGKLVMPGGVDPHTHLAMPFMGHVACDDFHTGHRAALAGGTTWHVDFALPAAAPAPGTAEAKAAARSKDGGAGAAMRRGYKEWREKARGKAVMDYSFHMAVTAWSDDVAAAMGELASPENGVNSFKFFMAYKGALMVTDDQLLQGLSRCRELRALPMVHAENGDAVALGQQRVAEGIRLPHGHALSRPKVLEDEATGRALRLAEYAGAPLYVVHVMSGGAAHEVAAARSRGARCVGEAVAPGLALDESRMWDANWTIAAAHVMSPPLRAEEDRQVLRRALAEGGALDVLATDHAAFNSSQKASGKADFRLIPNGIASIEERLHVGWTELVHKSGLVTPERFVALASANAARIFNAYPKKGRVAEGSDADVIVFDPRARHVLGRGAGGGGGGRHHSAVDVSAWEGYEAVGRVDVTIARGRVAWEGGRLRVPPPGWVGGGRGGKEEGEGEEGVDEFDASLAPGTGEFVPLPTGGAMFEGMERRGLLSGGGGGGGGEEEGDGEDGGGGGGDPHPAWAAEFPYGESGSPGAASSSSSSCSGGGFKGGVCEAAAAA